MEVLKNSNIALAVTDASLPCQTYYTTDGSVPNTNSNQYATPILIQQNTTLKYFSVDNAGNQEDIKTEHLVMRMNPIASPTTGNDTAVEFMWDAVAIPDTNTFLAVGYNNLSRYNYVRKSVDCANWEIVSDELGAIYTPRFLTRISGTGSIFLTTEYHKQVAPYDTDIYISNDNGATWSTHVTLPFATYDGRVCKLLVSTQDISGYRYVLTLGQSGRFADMALISYNGGTTFEDALSTSDTTIQNYRIFCGYNRPSTDEFYLFGSDNQGALSGSSALFCIYDSVSKTLSPSIIESSGAYIHKSVHAVYVDTDNTIWAVGEETHSHGTGYSLNSLILRIWKSTDNGVTWVSVMTQTCPFSNGNYTVPARLECICKAKNGNIIVGGVDGGYRQVIYTSTDNGNTWSCTLSTANHDAIYSLTEGRDYVLATGYAQSFFSLDGINWHE